MRLYLVIRPYLCVTHAGGGVGGGNGSGGCHASDKVKALRALGIGSHCRVHLCIVSEYLTQFHRAILRSSLAYVRCSETQSSIHGKCTRVCSMWKLHRVYTWCALAMRFPFVSIRRLAFCMEMDESCNILSGKCSSAIAHQENQTIHDADWLRWMTDELNHAKPVNRMCNNMFRPIQSGDARPEWTLRNNDLLLRCQPNAQDKFFRCRCRRCSYCWWWRVCRDTLHISLVASRHVRLVAFDLLCSSNYNILRIVTKELNGYRFAAWQMCASSAGLLFREWQNA